MENYDLLVIGGGPAGITLAKNMGKTVKMGVLDTAQTSTLTTKW
jgi:flavin-dependent dehydrogenase